MNQTDFKPNQSNLITFYFHLKMFVSIFKKKNDYIGLVFMNQSKLNQPNLSIIYQKNKNKNKNNYIGSVFISKQRINRNRSNQIYLLYIRLKRCKI